MEDDKILSLFEDYPKKALGLIYDEYYSYLWNQVFFIIKDDYETEDIIQDLFLELWKKDKLLKNINSSLKSYLKRAAINRALNRIKGRKSYEVIDEVIDEDERYVKKNQQPNLTEIGELELKIKNGINGLPPKCKEVFVLSRENGLSYRQISEQLDISIKTVENQIGKALKILRKKVLKE